VLDFNRSEGDRVMLDPGTTYTVSEVAGNVIITMSPGHDMALMGVSLSSLTPGWIVVA
jgi:small-conductance mechanosensitive channel